jgi:WD40 repeat protein
MLTTLARLCLGLGLCAQAGLSQQPELVPQTGHSGEAQAVAFSPDGRTLASASMDDSIKIWDAATGREVRTILGHRGWVLSLAFTPDGATLISGSQDDTIRFWDVATGRELKKFSAEEEVDSLALSPDGRVLASSSNHKVVLWDVSAGNTLPSPFHHENP